jgi:uncharacterized protein (TIGR00369 family)
MTEQGAVGIVSRDVLLAHDGLTFLKKLIAGEFPPPPITATLGYSLTEAEPGRVVFTGTPTFAHYNPIGTVHAGFAATLLDSAVFMAVFSTLAKGEAATTLELKLNLVRAITDKVGPLRAEGRLIYKGRSVATSEGHLTDAAGKLYAHATTTLMIFPAKG